MGNVFNGNSSYVDSTGVLTTQSVNVIGVVLTATAANAQIVLADKGGTVNKIDLRVATSGSSQLFDFSKVPILFPNGVKAVTVTNAIATLIYN